MNSNLEKISNKFFSIIEFYLGRERFNLLAKEIAEEFGKISTWSDADLDFDSSENIFRQNSRLYQFIYRSSLILSTGKYLDLLLTLGKTSLSFGNLNLSVRLYEMLVGSVFEETKYDEYEAYALMGLGEIFFRQGYWKESLNYISKAEKIFSTQKFPAGIVRCENIRGAIAGDQGTLDKSYEHFQNCLNILAGSKDKFLIAAIENNLGIISRAKEDNDNGLTFCLRALSKFEELNEIRRIAEVRYNIGTLFMQKSEFEKALTYLDYSIELSVKTEYKPTLSLCYLTKAEIYAVKNDLALASMLCDKSMDISYELNDRLSIADIYRIKGIIETKQENFKEAEKFFKISLKLNREVNNKFNYHDTYFELGLLYKAQNKKKEAKRCLSAVKQYKEKIGAEPRLIQIDKLLNEL